MNKMREKKEKNPEVLFKQRYELFRGIVNDIFIACLPMNKAHLENIMTLCDDMKKYAKKTIRYNKLKY